MTFAATPTQTPIRALRIGDCGTDYAGKPRPVVIVQDDRFDATKSVTICAFTSDPTDAPLIRLAVEPNERNGLRAISRLWQFTNSPVNAG